MEYRKIKPTVSDEVSSLKRLFLDSVERLTEIKLSTSLKRLKLTRLNKKERMSKHLGMRGRVVNLHDGNVHVGSSDRIRQ